jgi:hypothetical protein
MNLDDRPDQQGRDLDLPSVDPATGRVAFAETTDQSFAERAVAFEVLTTANGVILRGACPRCRDEMEFVHVERVYRGFGRSRRTGSERDGLVEVTCTCTGQHAGRPDDEQGCGAYWNLRLAPGER